MVAWAMLAGGPWFANAAKLKLEGKSLEEVEAQARRSGVVPRALRGKLLLTTVTGILNIEFKKGGIAGAELIGTNGLKYLISNDAGHFFKIKPYMNGKKVEAQFQLSKPGDNVIGDVRFVDVLKGQAVDLSREQPVSRINDRDIVSSSGRKYFVAPNGNNRNPGTKDKPFLSIKRGTVALQAGDTLYLRKGHYPEEINITDLKGTATEPITVTAYDGEEVVVDGSEDLNDIAAGSWEKHKGNIYKRKLKARILQLWKDGRMVMIARWPKITKNWTEDMDPRFNGRLPEPGTAWNYDSYFAGFDPLQVRANFKPVKLKDSYQPDYDFTKTKYDPPKYGSHGMVRKLAVKSLNPLRQVGKSFTGAVVEGLANDLAVITRHQAGSDYFEVVFGNYGKKITDSISKGRFVIRNHLNCLDSVKEWVYDVETRTVYVKMEDGDLPQNHQYRGRTAEFISRISKSSHVTVSNIDFFACALRSVNSPGTVIENCRFSFPTYRPIVMGIDKPHEVTVLPGKRKKPKKTIEDKFIFSALNLSPGGTLRNCVIEYYQSSGVEFSGAPALIENCYLHHGERYAVIFTRSPGCVARRNTIHSTLRQGAIRIRKTPEGRFTSELNYGYDFGCWRSDASGTQVQSGSQGWHMFRYNWFHHSECKALRFDGQPAGTLGTAVGNVGWRLWQGMQIKGDYQKTFNNTMFECGRRHDISVINSIAFGGGTHSITRNNLGDRISGHRTSENIEGIAKIPGFHSNNWNGLVKHSKVRDLLRDPDNFDFRPRNNPEIVDAGTTVVDDRFIEGSSLDNLFFVNHTPDGLAEAVQGGNGKYNAHTRRYVGRAPDIGAYEYGDKHYRIPGRQLQKAGFPIPPDNARYVKTDADLMWLEGRGAVSHNVYFGTDKEKVANANKDSAQYQGSFTASNIFTPRRKLKKETTYYWRIDALKASGSVFKGDVWSFLPCDGRYTEYTRIAEPTDFQAKLKEGNFVELTWKGVEDKRLVGYNIYRREGNFVYVKLNGVRLTPKPITETTFIDTTIDGNGRFYYVIEAVDKMGISSHEVGPVAVSHKQKKKKRYN